MSRLGWAGLLLILNGCSESVPSVDVAPDVSADTGPALDTAPSETTTTDTVAPQDTADAAVSWHGTYRIGAIGQWLTVPAVSDLRATFDPNGSGAITVTPAAPTPGGSFSYTVESETGAMMTTWMMATNRIAVASQVQVGAGAPVCLVLK